MQKWPGTQNPADLMTKNLGRADTERYCDYLSFRSLPGRAVVSPLRQGTWKVHNVVAAPLSSQYYHDPDYMVWGPDPGNVDDDSFSVNIFGMISQTSKLTWCMENLM